MNKNIYILTRTEYSDPKYFMTGVAPQYVELITEHKWEAKHRQEILIMNGYVCATDLLKLNNDKCGAYIKNTVKPGQEFTAEIQQNLYNLQLGLKIF